MAALEDCWTKSLKNIPKFSYQKLEEHLVHDAKKTADSRPAEAFKHKSSGYRLFKARYSRQLVVKPNVKKGDKGIYFLVRCRVLAEMFICNILFMCTWIKVLGMLLLQSVPVLPMLEAIVNM